MNKLISMKYDEFLGVWKHIMKIHVIVEKLNDLGTTVSEDFLSCLFSILFYLSLSNLRFTPTHIRNHGQWMNSLSVCAKRREIETGRGPSCSCGFTGAS